MYLDPAFGGMLLQAVVVLAAVGGGILFSLRRKIRNFFTRDKTTLNAAKKKNVQLQADDAVDPLAAKGEEDS